MTEKTVEEQLAEVDYSTVGMPVTHDPEIPDKSVEEEIEEYKQQITGEEEVDG